MLVVLVWKLYNPGLNNLESASHLIQVLVAQSIYTLNSVYSRLKIPGKDLSSKALVAHNQAKIQGYICLASAIHIKQVLVDRIWKTISKLADKDEPALREKCRLMKVARIVSVPSPWYESYAFFPPLPDEQIKSGQFAIVNIDSWGRENIHRVQLWYS